VLGPMVTLNAIFGWMQTHHELLSWLAVISLLTFVVTLFAVVILIIHIPDKYFLHDRRISHNNPKAAIGFRLVCRILKNILGVFFVLIGLIMLFLPGQGLLSILIGVMLMNFPGKYKVERAIIRQRKVLSSINWLRAKAHRPPLQVEYGE
jgi:archaellum biogenesis protein FlaJ (TadC family)